MTFQRENRYIVIKLKDLHHDEEEALRNLISGCSIRTRECLVIESDWPEYEPAWRMIQARVEGATLSPAHIEDEREACERWIRQRSGMPAHIPMDWDLPFNRSTWAAWSARAALSAPPAAGVPIGMACKINGYWEAQLFAGHGCIDRQSLYAHPLPPADVPTGLAHRLLKAYDHGDTGAIEAAIEDIRTLLAAAPTPPASEQQDEPKYGPTPGCKQCEEALSIGLESCPECDAEFHAPASEQQRAVVMPEGKLLVSAEPLRKVLFALLGAPHHIRELQATRTPTDLFADNPINVLIAELNAAQGGDA